jgi:hypothetical protein
MNISWSQFPVSLYKCDYIWVWCLWIRASYYNSYRNSQRDATVYQNFLLFHVYIKINMFRATHRPSSGALNCTSSLWFCIRKRLFNVVVAGRCQLSLTTTTSNNLSCMQNQRLLVQFWAPDDGWCVAETCWTLYKHEIIKSFDTLLHLVGYFYMNYVWVICVSTVGTVVTVTVTHSQTAKVWHRTMTVKI